MGSPLEGTTRDAVLVVDDVQENVDILVAVLGGEYRVKAALSGERAIAIASRPPHPDVILLDVEMPGMDGFTVCRHLRSNIATSSIPVIFITARDSVSDKLRGFEAGAVDYVTKPFEAAEVRARVRTHLDLRRARETIRRYSEDLEQMLKVRTRELVRSERQAAFGQLVQGIVHNMRSPLATIVMALEELGMATEAALELRGTEGELEELRTLTRVIDTVLRVAPTSSQRISQMLESLMARSRAGKKSEPEVIDLNALVRTELDFLQADRRFRHKCKQVIELSSEPLLVTAVPGELAQVFHNLACNALDAMHDQPVRRITVRTEPAGSAQDTVAFRVTDTGPGVPEAVRERVFDPFFTTKPAKEDLPAGVAAPTGNGLGLWMCRETVEGFGGEIGFDSTPEGTTFWVKLPRAERAAFEELVR